MSEVDFGDKCDVNFIIVKYGYIYIFIYMIHFNYKLGSFLKLSRFVRIVVKMNRGGWMIDLNPSRNLSNDILLF